MPFPNLSVVGREGCQNVCTSHHWEARGRGTKAGWLTVAFWKPEMPTLKGQQSSNCRKIHSNTNRTRHYTERQKKGSLDFGVLGCSWHHLLWTKSLGIWLQGVWVLAWHQSPNCQEATQKGLAVPRYFRSSSSQPQVGSLGLEKASQPTRPFTAMKPSSGKLVHWRPAFGQRWCTDYFGDTKEILD
jgi:hypothetical protein